MCITPVILKKSKLKETFIDDFTNLQVPCGKCIECKKQRVNSWYVRLENELKRSTSAYFVTLTYDDTNLPYTDNLNDTLHFADVQRMFKRLRKKEAKKHTNKLAYYCVGEYGERYYRPHYHLIVFNLSSPDVIIDEWLNKDLSAPMGFVHVGKVEPASIFYALKYTLKSSYKDKDETTDRVSEKAIMSKGLGENFLTDEQLQKYRDDPSRSITMLGNKKLSLPRYYRDKIFKDDFKKLINLRNFKLKKFIDKKQLEKYEHNYTHKQRRKIKLVEKNLKKTD